LQSDLLDEAGITGSISAVRILILLVVIILCLGWLNYVVLTTTSASERINEYYVRKVLGSSKWQLIKLKLLESFIISTCAFLVSTSLFFLGKNLYKILINRDLNFIPFERLEVLLVVLLIFTSGLLIISFYPALTLISFNIRDGLTRGSGVVSPKLNFRRYLMIFEITVTSVLLSGSILINKQINYMQKEDKNFNVDQFIIESPRNADLSFERRMKLFKETIRNNLTFVNGISYSSSVPGSSMVDKIGQVHLPSMDDKVNETVYFVEIDEDYIPNYDIPIVAGKNFTSDSKYYEEIIINMKTLAILGFSNPQEAIDQIISTEDESFRIIGVVEDFHIETLKNDFKPLFFIYDDAAFGFMAVNFKKNVDLNSSIEQIKQFWEDVFPENEFVYFNLSDYFDQQYYKYNEFGKIIIAFTIFSIIIACISLFGSTWHSINNKKKEIGIRKVFGSDKLNVAKLLLKDITFIHLIAFGISIPIAYIISAKWLESFAYHISLDIISLILVPCVIIFIISIATVIYQTIKVSFVSPITVLRDE